MNWNNIKITIHKELRGVIRDKKSLQKLILYPLMIPFVIILFGVLFDSVNETKYKVGTNYEPTQEEISIIEELDTVTLKNYNNKYELEKAYNNNEIDAYLVKENDIYTIYADESQNSGEIILSVTSTYLEMYNDVLGNKYLLENGINPDKVYNNITIKTHSLKKEESNVMTNLVFSLVITYLVMIVVMVCVVVVTDATSGEKERGTLETILTFPIKSSELILGKYLATAILAFIIGFIAYFLAIPTFIIGKELFKSYEEIVFNTDIIVILLVIFVILLSAFLAAGICMALAGKAKTYKEAQSALQFISLLPMIPYFIKIMETDIKIVNLIPIANCGTLLNDIVANDINYKSLLTVVVTTIIYIVAIIIYISKQYNKEETLFS
ncbi:MAG: ABC transporter permease [Bacilli bacterium]|nr:ABC transporter permease [Bacilli bacterium]